jgi:hypothetical protein
MTGGETPITTFDNRDVENPSVAVRVRGSRIGYQAAYDLSKQILDELHGKSEVTVNNNRYLGIFATSDILAIGRDTNDRPIFSVNFRMMKTPA